MDEETICAPVWIDVRWTVRDQSNPECNHHLKWRDSTRLVGDDVHRSCSPRRTRGSLRAEVDYAGYDLVLGCNGCVRHVPLKSSHGKPAARALQDTRGLTAPRFLACTRHYSYLPGGTAI